MFNSNLLKAKMVEKGITALDVCREIGVCEATFYRKISRNGDFSRFEIQKITKLLELTPAEQERIFFAEKLA